VESGNEYLLQVKGNEPKLLRAIKETILFNRPIDYDYTLEINRGREENREAYVYSIINNEVYEKWYGIKRIIHIRTHGIRKGKVYEENRYYITSRPESSASYYNKKIRNHWKIENCLHWVKDKILNEDKCMIKGMKLAENVAAIRNIVINVFKINGEKSIKYAIGKYTNRLEKCLELIHKKHIF
jgi:hypothetical protein